MDGWRGQEEAEVYAVGRRLSWSGWILTDFLPEFSFGSCDRECESSGHRARVLSVALWNVVSRALLVAARRRILAVLFCLLSG